MKIIEKESHGREVTVTINYFPDLVYYFGIVLIELHILLNYSIAKDYNSYENFHKMASCNLCIVPLPC